MNSTKKSLLANLKYIRSMGKQSVYRKDHLFLEEWLGIIREVNVRRKILYPLQ